MPQDIVSGTLASAVADGGTFVTAYPSNRQKGDYYGAMGHKLTLGQNNTYSFPADFDITLGNIATGVTVTNRSGATWAAGTPWKLGLERLGSSTYRLSNGQMAYSVVKGDVVLINLGAPAAISANAVAAAQAVAGAGDLTLTSTVVTLDRPRAVQIDSSDAGDTTQTATVYGTDMYGASLIETIAFNGTTNVNGKKAFKTITRIAISAAMTGNAVVGTTDILGLPVFLPETAFVLKELQDGVAATAGTLVAGIRTGNGSTATTGDIRGTYVPNAATDDSKVYQLIVFVPDSALAGISQYAG